MVTDRLDEMARQVRGGRPIVGYCATDSVSADALLDYCGAWLDADESARLLRFRDAEDGRDYLCAHGLARATLARCLGILPHEVVFYRRVGEKPVLCPERHGGGLDFSLSHARGLVACAIQYGPGLGVDVEETAIFAEASLASGKWLSARELDHIAGEDAAGSVVRLARYWTLKEAYVKAMGTGFRLPFSSLCFENVGSGFPVLVADAPVTGGGRPWRFWSRPLGDSHMLALCSSTGEVSGQPVLFCWPLP